MPKIILSHFVIKNIFLVKFLFSATCALY